MIRIKISGLRCRGSQRMPRIAAAVVCLVLGLFASGSAQAQILMNPGFETGDKTGWTMMGDSDYPDRWQIVTSPVHEGSYALFVDNWPKDLTCSFLSVPVSTISEFSFWMDVTLDSTTMVVFWYADGTDKSISLKNTAGGYSKKDVTSQMDLSKDLNGFRITTWSPNDPGAVDTYYDSFTLTVIPEGGANCLILVGMGLLAAFGVSRRLICKEKPGG